MIQASDRSKPPPKPPHHACHSTKRPSRKNAHTLSHEFMRTFVSKLTTPHHINISAQGPAHKKTNDAIIRNDEDTRHEDGSVTSYK